MTNLSDSFDPQAQAPAWFWIALVAITLLAGALRSYKLDAPSFWVDELYTVKWSVDVCRGEFHGRPLAYPPHALGYWLAGVDLAHLEQEDYATWKSAGITEVVARMPTMLTGVLSVFVLGWLSRRMIGWQAALVLALVLALSSWHLWVSQTARFYAQQFLLYSICYILYYDATRRGSRSAMVATAVFMVLAFFTQLTSLLLVAVFAVDWAVGQLRREPVRWGSWGWLCLGGATAFCALFYLASLSGDVGGHISSFSGSKQTGKDLVLGLPFLVGFPLAAFSLLTLGCLWSRNSRLCVLLLANMFIPLIVFVVFKELLGLDVHVRYLIISLYAWLVPVAIGLWMAFDCIRPRGGLVLACGPAALVVVVMAFGDLVYFDGACGNRARWREAFDYVREHRKSGELVGADFIPHLVGNYYLQDRHDEILGIDESLDGVTYERLTEGRPLWIVVRGVSPTKGARFGWVDRHADLRAYYATQTYQPYASIHVYYYDPAWGSDEPRSPLPD